MAKPTLTDPLASLERDLVEAIRAALETWRPTLASAMSYSDGEACARGMILRLFSIERREEWGGLGTGSTTTWILRRSLPYRQAGEATLHEVLAINGGFACACGGAWPCPLGAVSEWITARTAEQ